MSSLPMSHKSMLRSTPVDTCWVPASAKRQKGGRPADRKRLNGGSPRMLLADRDLKERVPELLGHPNDKCENLAHFTRADTPLASHNYFLQPVATHVKSRPEKVIPIAAGRQAWIPWAKTTDIGLLSCGPAPLSDLPSVGGAGPRSLILGLKGPATPATAKQPRQADRVRIALCGTKDTHVDCLGQSRRQIPPVFGVSRFRPRRNHRGQSLPNACRSAHIPAWNTSAVVLHLTQDAPDALAAAFEVRP